MSTIAGPLVLVETLSKELDTVECPSPGARLQVALNLITCYAKAGLHMHTTTASTDADKHVTTSSTCADIGGGDIHSLWTEPPLPPPHIVMSWHGTTVGATGNATGDETIMQIVEPVVRHWTYGTTVDKSTTDHDDTNPNASVRNTMPHFVVVLLLTCACACAQHYY